MVGDGGCSAMLEPTHAIHVHRILLIILCEITVALVSHSSAVSEVARVSEFSPRESQLILLACMWLN